jgi:GNAT superfamily N-acetyltransferase
MTQLNLHIRDARLPEERPQLCEFILGSQRFEHAFEPNRRLDPPVGAEYFAVLEEEVRSKGGKMLVAARDGEPLLGWAVVHFLEDDVFVSAGERKYAYLSELYVAESERGKGVGRALIEACEDWARGQGLHVMQIGVLPDNRRAATIYEQAGFAPYGVRLRKYLP